MRTCHSPLDHGSSRNGASTSPGCSQPLGLTSQHPPLQRLRGSTPDTRLLQVWDQPRSAHPSSWTPLRQRGWFKVLNCWRLIQLSHQRFPSSGQSKLLTSLMASAPKQEPQKPLRQCLLAWLTRQPCCCSLQGGNPYPAHPRAAGTSRLCPSPAASRGRAEDQP